MLYICQWGHLPRNPRQKTTAGGRHPQWYTSQFLVKFDEAWWLGECGKIKSNHPPDLCSVWHVTSALSLFTQSTSRSTTTASMETSMKRSLLEMWMRKQRSWFRPHTNASCKPSTLVGMAVWCRMFPVQLSPRYFYSVWLLPEKFQQVTGVTPEVCLT